MIISIIAAIAANGVIGKENKLPWHLPADMKHFRDLTRGKPVIMGSKTFESIGRPLPDRLNIVLSSDLAYRAEGAMVVHSIDEALQAAGDAQEVMVIGGGSIYKQFLPRANRMYLTLIHTNFKGDAFFPEYEKKEWNEVAREEHGQDEKNAYAYSFVILERS
jgi:dihydrofolate reductase